MADTEEYFPRGGKKPTAIFKQSANFLGDPDRGDKKKKKHKKKSEGDDGYLSDDAGKEIDQSTKNCAVGLSYKTVKEGVLVLGRVRCVYDTKLTVMLPCKLMGNVMACHISDAYNKILEAYVNDQTDEVCELTKMFRRGQYISVKVLENKEKSLMLSMMPQHVNGGKSIADVVKGSILQAAVSSIEDHGYVMDIGIPNARAFLPKKDVNPEVELEVGMVTWCAVKAVSPSVVTVSAAPGALQGALLKSRPPGGLIPGSCVEFTVDTPLENGIEGVIFGDTTSYIQRQHVDKVKGKKPTLGQKIRGRVLYVLPTRNTPFLTMKNIFETAYPDMEKEQTLRDGDIVEQAQVLKIIGRSVHFKLGRGALGLLSLRRIQVEEDLADEEVVAKSYPIGSKHKVRVLCYNLSDYVYSVTDQPEIVNEPYFSLEQLHPGQMVDATFTGLQDKHATLAVGRCKGIVPHTHLTDAGVMLDPKARISNLANKKYKVGQKVRARVLIVDPARLNLVLTLKPSLLAGDLQPLTSYEDAQVGKAYTGVIRYICGDYLLVSFFGHVKAYVPRMFISRDAGPDPRAAFHLGQIVNCTILNKNVEDKKMSGSLITAPFTPDENRKKGKRKHTDTESEEPKEQAVDKKNKKTKITDEGEPEIKKKKKKRDSETSNTEEYVNSYDNNTKSKHKKKETEVKVSEESDAIETDIYEEEILTPHEQGLVDLSDCTTVKDFKKRLVAITKSVEARCKRKKVVENKIANIEEKGLNAKNKKYHTAMHNEKLTTEERIKKLEEVKEVVFEKLKELDNERNVNYKEEQKKRKLEKKLAKKEAKKNAIGDTDTQNDADDGMKEVSVDLKRKMKDIKVLENLEPVLDVPSAKDFFFGDADAVNNAAPVQEESSSSDEETTEQPKKKRKKQTVAEKLAKLRAEEERIRSAEEAAAAGDPPRSIEQFQRALLATPAASQLWIAYMAFHLQATEVEKARAVARRALAAIPFREEQDKLNVWLALLGLEHRFGTKESQQKTLDEALQMNEPYQVHSGLLDILVDTGKQHELSALAELVVRRYRRAGACLAAGAACYKLGLQDKARYIMQKALGFLDKKEHVAVLVQFALMESRSGARERAEALFEQVLAVYPQRVDVCCTYVDMLLKDNDLPLIRQVLERMTSQMLPARKMKTLYKKWIEVEEKLGDQAQVENIKQKAMEFIEKAKF